MLFGRALLIATASLPVYALPSKQDVSRPERRWLKDTSATTYTGTGIARLNATTVRDAECKSCPYGNCVNVGLVRAENKITVQCFTQGDKVGQSITWLKYQFAEAHDQFCYIHSYDMRSNGNYVSDLPYCGTKSELHFYLPSIPVKTIYYAECSLCPYRECEGVKYYQSGTTVDVNCKVTDGWNQVGPLHPEGSKTYYRTPDNCYVSTQFVEEAPPRVINIAASPSPIIQEILPPCGPVPVLRSADRPGLIDDSFVPSRPIAPGPVNATIPRVVQSTLPAGNNTHR